MVGADRVAVFLLQQRTFEREGEPFVRTPLRIPRHTTTAGDTSA
jgi:hypothetical protein